MSLSYNITVLDNGLTIISEPVENLQTVALNIGIKIGSRYEKEAIGGITHFLEHMAFKGTHKRTAQKIAEEFDSIGGQFNAYTSKEETVYSTKVLKNDLSIALDIFADVLQNSVFDPDEIQRELLVILQEIAESYDTPDDIILDYLYETAFPRQPLGRSILGIKKTIDKCNQELLRSYVKKHYSANNMIITAVGAVNHDSLVSIVTEKFSLLKYDNSLKYEKAKYHGGSKFYIRELEQVQMMLGFESVSYHDADYYTVQVLAIILGGGISSRLFQEIREKRGLAYSIGAFNNCYDDVGIFGIYAGADALQLEELIEHIIIELLKVSQTISIQELDRARTQCLAGIVMSQENSSFKARELTHNYSIYGRHISISENIEKINDVTIDDVTRLAKKIFCQSKPSLVAMGKLKNEQAYLSKLEKLSNQKLKQ